jgi:hypothetical protein
MRCRRAALRTVRVSEFKPRNSSPVRQNRLRSISATVAQSSFQSSHITWAPVVWQVAPNSVPPGASSLSNDHKIGTDGETYVELKARGDSELIAEVVRRWADVLEGDRKPKVPRFPQRNSTRAKEQNPAQPREHGWGRPR